MDVTVIPIVIGALGTIPIGLVKGLDDLEIRGEVETIQSTALLRSARILSRVLETVSQTSAKNHLQMLVGKTIKEVK